MLTTEKNELLCRTDPGTPAGDFMRRYWLPVALSADVTARGKPRQLRVMGEDLVLFRDEFGRPGLVGLHCSHRLTSLAYGRVEDGGIRCPFHGWLYDINGHCLEQPAEPENSTFKERIRHPAYPCQDLGGLIFSYMGPPENQPCLPRYDVLAREDGTRVNSAYPMSCNYVQAAEGVLDTVHFPYLHSNSWSRAKRRLASSPKASPEIAETDYGIWQKSDDRRDAEGNAVPTYSYFVMPASFLRVQPALDHGDGADGEPQAWAASTYKKFWSWYTPVDDTRCMRLQAAFCPLGPSGEPYEWPTEVPYRAPGPANDYFRDYDGVDTLSGIPWEGPGTGLRNYLAQDNMANETQGPIEDRSREHLGAHDHVLTLMRKIMLQAIEDVRSGDDPKHIVRSGDGTLYIRGTEPGEQI